MNFLKPILATLVKKLFIGTGLSGGSSFDGSADVTLSVAFGTTSSTACVGNDARLSDARTPTSHVHGNVTNDGKIGSTSGLIIKTGTAGALEALAAGTTDKFLRGDGSWQTPPGAQMLGTAATKIFSYNAQTLSENITVGATQNAYAAGPVTVSDGVTLTIESGGRLVIL